MANGRAQPNSNRPVLADVDGYEEPGVVVEHALATIRGPLHQFFADMFKASPASERRWHEVRDARAKIQGGKQAKATRNFSPDSRALLTDITAMKSEFVDALETLRACPRERAEGLFNRIAYPRDIDFIGLCNQAPHGTPMDCSDAAEVLTTLRELAQALGDSVEALRLQGPANGLALRARWRPFHAGPVSQAVKSAVTCVGVHWVQPRRVFPGEWWIVTVDKGGALDVRADQKSEDVVRYLTQEVAGPVLAGLAFCFSAPRDVLLTMGMNDPSDMWSRCEESTASADRSWVSDGGFPERFRVVEERERGGLRRPQQSPEDFRDTERDIADTLGVNPASILDVGGDGSVGALALKGMPMLTDLRSAGARIWPFDQPDLEGSSVTCVEIFPRSLWTSVFPDECPKSKKNRMRRWNFIADIEANDGVVVPPARAAEAANDERAFDALLTAWALRRYGANVLKLPRDSDASRLEGTIWTPTRRPLKAGREGPRLTC